MSRIQYASEKEAESVMSWWKGDASSLKLVSKAANTIYFFKDNAGAERVLRLMDPNFRTRDEVQAELDFIAHLQREEIQVAGWVPAINARGVINTPSGNFLASVFEFVDGFEMQAGTDHWNDHFFEVWGRHLAALHKASQKLQVPQFAPHLWTWDQEVILREAEKLIPPDDAFARAACKQIVETCKRVVRSPEIFGVIHADYQPQNFRYRPMSDDLVAFDFGNACYHWYAMDLICTFSAVRNHEERSRIEEGILRGYEQIRPLAPIERDMLPLMRALRALYIYLDRLYWAGPQPTAVEQARVKVARAYLESLVSAKKTG